MKQSPILWGNVAKRTFPILKKSQSCKWLIVGGGIGGLATAHFLLEAGETGIVLVEGYTIGSGSTGHSAGMLVHEPEHARWSHYVAAHGSRQAKKYFAAQLSALNLVQKIITEGNISCDLEKESMLVLANTKSEMLELLSDAAAMNKIDKKYRTLSQNQLPHSLQSAGYLLGKKVYSEISVNPLAFARGFAKNLMRRGVTIYEGTLVTDITPTHATTTQGTIAFERAFLCQGTHDQNPDIRSYINTIAVSRKLSKKELSQTGFTEETMFSDDYKDSFFYGKVTADRRLLIGYGDVLATPKKLRTVYTPHLRILTRYVKKHFSDVLPFDYVWSAPYSLTYTDLPLIEANGTTIRVNGGGTQLVTISVAEYAVALALKKKHPLSSLFKP